ncbi:hypothetical protein PsB1_1454 [Candidatus Phycosocius spiralis]|uniref:Uncharacterized protein n=1 Tax=Candidatus Phycosocius spiralis TaxID=2815099 RepID=A0ABQ4PWD4_9PROT|nr:hypothetical protein PsB1_1454 [Candidatus Phycosocius spiralis]
MSGKARNRLDVYSYRLKPNPFTHIIEQIGVIAGESFQNPPSGRDKPASKLNVRTSMGRT